MTTRIFPIISLLFCNLNIIAQEFTLPFQLFENKYILLKLPTENGKDSLTFYFDTGASATLMDREIAKRHGLVANHTQKIKGASGEQSYEMVRNQEIYLAGKHYISEVDYILEDLSRLNSLSEFQFDGIIGNDILKNFITRIDFETRQISLYKKGSVLDTNSYTEIPFTFKNGIKIPQFPIQIELMNGEIFSGDILFDSGAGLSLLLNTPFQEQHNVLEKSANYYTTTTNNLSSQTKTITTMVNKLKIGNFEFNRLPMNVSSDKAGVSAFKDYLGILGSGIINRFNIILDYDAMKLYLKPNALFNHEFTIEVSPLKLKKTPSGIAIESVVENSAAEKSGMKQGQEIISINGNNMGDINTYLAELRKEGTMVTIQYLDNGVLKTANFKLVKLL